MRILSYLGAIGTSLYAFVVLPVVQATTIPRAAAYHPVRGEFASKIVQDGKLSYVRNSGVCETTPGVGQLSGYIDVGTNMSMWFWFFEARHDPENAPFTLWINGGPGTTSMEGVFQENGPCHVNPDGETTTLNPYSWNNISNIIYIDQPIGTGFSYGTIDVNSTFAAAPVVWTAFQVLFESKEFAKFQSREFVFATESYGGHYGPEFVTYFDEQNAMIRSGQLKGEYINVSALMINNGWYDPLIQNEAYVQFATFAPGYGQLQSDEVLAQLNQSFYGSGGCQEQERACYAAGESPESNGICARADAFCIENVFTPAVGDRDSLDLRQNGSSLNPFPPEFFIDFLQNATIMERIGAKTPFMDVSIAVELQFNSTGDDARSLLPQLAALANSKLKILVWAGDADINCNWLGVHHSMLAMDWYGNETLHRTPFKNMTIHGKSVAAIQNVDNFSFARVYEAGHQVPAFQPEASLEIFSQIVRKEQLHSIP
ncbi:alpha/beta-hydrolase [Trametes coccinea BRFM310]|uniref:Alpha/beta-hydrolase n=1 Tax=Trametes coccinea (strain BRFM310) TaxID=1353009 RepID=A0A1Y2IG46_TRAC3|nr:alpha/beta-hydrolase [Trametes coccinea BRFM310]